jgi:hypothetical protein
MKAKGRGFSSAAVVFSPNASNTHFLPISKTLFANNKAEVSLADGMPESWKQDTDGELIGLLKLPADIIGAYFSAVGEMFEGFSSADEKQVEAITQDLKLQLARQKYQACTLAIQSDNKELVEALGCGS